MKRKIFSLLMAFLFVVTLSSCGKNKKVEVSYSQSEISMQVGETKEVVPSVTLGKKVKDFELTYAVSDPTKASVDTTGKVTALAAGEVTLTAKGNDKNETSASITIKISALPEYTVTFDAAGGSSVASQTVTKGQTATQPTAPTKAGYVFKGWTLNGAAYNFATPVTGNVTLVASWEENAPTTYTVTFDAAGGSSVASQTVTEGGVATEPTAPTKAGYVFKGWTLNGAAYNFATVVTGNITLVASW